MNKSLVNQLTGAEQGRMDGTGGCWDDYSDYGSFPKIPCVKRTSKSMDVDLPMACQNVT
jgi:hypothetical protein